MERAFFMSKNYSEAIFAGGCFWCMDPPFRNTKGVIDVISGYTGGQSENPSYEEVCEGDSGHIEAIKIIFDAEIVSYEDLVELFWQQIDPTDADGQFVDRGTQYKTAIFYLDQAQKESAQRSKDQLDASKKFPKPVATLIIAAEKFYPAEDYHQNFANKKPMHYKKYRYASGREAFLRENWKK